MTLVRPFQQELAAVTIRTVRLAIIIAAILGVPTLAAAQATPQDQARAVQVIAAEHGSVSLFENVEFFIGLDGSKQPQDLGINANMGVRFAVNAGIPLSRSNGLGAQIGVATNLSDAAVHVLDQVEGTSRRTQTFLTFGVFQKNVSRFSWAVGYDYLHETYYDTFNLGQVRAQAGYGVTANDEVGAWFTKSVQSDSGAVATTAVQLDPISQVNGYLRHTWPTNARTAIWAGVATHHHNVVLLLPGDTRDEHVMVYGAQLEMPLSNRFSITGTGNFLTPTATGTVDAYLGVTYYPGSRGTPGGRGRFAPAMTIGNNPEFPVDLSR
jgi:hypothetical protein